MGATPGGLPYPEDVDPVSAGAQNIKALAQAVEAMIQGQSGGASLDIYQALQSLAGSPVYPAARWPLAYTVNPEIAQDDIPIGGDQRGAALMVRKQVSSAAMGYYVTVSATGTLSGYIGANLYYYDGSATMKHMCNTGASKPGSFGNATGWKYCAWRNAGDTADTPVTLSPGIVYMLTLTMGSWTTSAANVAAARMNTGIQQQVNFAEAGGFQRSIRINPRTAITAVDIPSGSHPATGYIPLLIVL